MPRRAPLKQDALDQLVRRAVPARCVLDVGVLTGTPELIRAYPDLPHILFEPVAELKDAISATYRGVLHQIVTAAVSDAEGEVEIEIHTDKDNGAVTHAGMVAPGAGRGGARRTTAAVTLDGFLKGRDLPEPFVLKIDVDGAELQVLAGAQETLERCSIVIVECTADTLCERIAAVQAAGFRLFDLAEPCYYDGAFWQCDAVFVREDLHAQFFTRITDAADPALYETFRKGRWPLFS
ncbi:FkbM family methyltransferase [Alkalicaulis satelles]|uniref:FkbM family methyltransferase n=1 Tax=Alkalicaulis satelles TaxID=2609175 RepID=A0A5M6ZK62_9PROT|nr:FkbM family methyltransferase [Alkalicaulis satelles]KAA5804067.1 FkbM family methyltransferase [Alkalicaulis satelles]